MCVDSLAEGYILRLKPSAVSPIEERAMDNDAKLPSHPKEPKKREPKAPEPQPGSEPTFEDLERWINSSGLQPPK
jgi:hypothetical protein